MRKIPRKTASGDSDGVLAQSFWGKDASPVYSPNPGGNGLPIDQLLAMHPDGWQAPNASKWSRENDSNGIGALTAATAKAITDNESSCCYRPPCADCARASAEQAGEMRAQREGRGA